MSFIIFSSKRRHTRFALVTGFQTCALPIYIGSSASLSTPGRKGPRPMPRKPSMTCVHPAAIVRMLVGATDCVADAAGPRLVEYTNTTTSAQSANVQIEEDVSAIQIHGRAIAAATAGTPRIHRTSLTCRD